MAARLLTARGFLWTVGISPIPILSRSSVSSASQDFFDKNKKLRRPMSPYASILIFNPNMAATLSISHRITGAVMAAEVSAVSIWWLASGKSFTQFLDGVNSLALHPHLITTGKFFLAFPLTYHFFNALRHLAWDMGKGFEMKTLYTTGYLVIAASLLSAIGLALYKPS